MASPGLALSSAGTGPETVLVPGGPDVSWADSPDPDDLPSGLTGGLLPIPDLDFSCISQVHSDPSPAVPPPSSPPRLSRVQSRGLTLSQPVASASRSKSRSRKGSF